MRVLICCSLLGLNLVACTQASEEPDVRGKESVEVEAPARPRTELLSPWPFTVDAVELRCPVSGGAGSGMVTATTEDGMEYALNGAARSRYPPVDPIWEHNASIPGTRIDIGPAISRALELCDGRSTRASVWISRE